MKYMLMMSAAAADYERYVRWPKEVLEANVAFMHAFNARLRASGELVLTCGLDAPAHARRVSLGRDGLPMTDGVFPESKEFLAGFWIVEVTSDDRAHEIAGEAAAAPNPGGRTVEVEVRKILGGHQELANRSAPGAPDADAGRRS